MLHKHAVIIQPITACNLRYFIVVDKWVFTLHDVALPCSQCRNGQAAQFASLHRSWQLWCCILHMRLAACD